MDPVSAIFGAIGAGLKALTPTIESHVAQQFNQDQEVRTRELFDILSRPDSADRARDLGAFIDRLLVAAHNPTGPVSGVSIEIPMEHFIALVGSVSTGINQSEQLARLTLKLG